jgi:ribonuclease J
VQVKGAGFKRSPIALLLLYSPWTKQADHIIYYRGRAITCRRTIILSNSHELRLAFLGGVGEIGMNCLALETPQGTVIVDCGVMFPDNRFAGPDLIIPDLRYFAVNRDRIVAVVVTHGHEDHIGAIPIIFGDLHVPVYAPPFAATIIKAKTPEYTTSPAFVLHPIKPGDRLTLAGMDFEFFRVTHSIPDALALSIETPVGRIVHTGDFRIDLKPSLGEPFDRKGFARLGEEGVFLLLSDSTNAEVPGRTGPESEVAASLTKLAAGHKGRILVTMFSSNIERLSLFAKVAKKLKRRVALVGRSLNTYTKAALESGFDVLDPNRLVDPRHIEDLPDEELFLLIAGSQGEPRAALTRIANCEHPDVRIKSSDLVIYSSKVIPGNEKAIQRVSNDLVKSGAKVLHERNAKVHTSGHGKREEVIEVLELLRPKHFIPVHGEYRFLHEHAEIAREVVGANTLIADWGDVIALTEKGPEYANHMDLEHYFVERPLVGNATELRLKERRKLLHNGLITVHAVVKKRGKGVSVHSEVTLYGVPDPDDNLENLIQERIQSEFGNRRNGLSERSIEEEIRIVARRTVKKLQKRKPLVHVFLSGGKESR